MLHILNGDSSATVLQQTDLPGENFAWREALIAGPTPAGLSKDKWIDARARHLSTAYQKDFEFCKQSLLEQETLFDRIPEEDDVTLWFEHDLFCQVNMIYLLHWLAQISFVDTKLFLICIGAFPGIRNFSGLGQLRPEQMTELFEKRSAITSAQFSLASDAWAAYTSPSPMAIKELLNQDAADLPFLRPALLAHLARFPSTQNGLGRIQGVSLELIASGITDFEDLFRKFGEREPIYGLGDWQFWNETLLLAQGKSPLLEFSSVGDMASALQTDDFMKATFSITPVGEQVLAEQADFVELNDFDYWLGGVHMIPGKELWRWDAQSARLVEPNQ